MADPGFRVSKKLIDLVDAGRMSIEEAWTLSRKGTRTRKEHKKKVSRLRPSPSPKGEGPVLRRTKKHTHPIITTSNSRTRTKPSYQGLDLFEEGETEGTPKPFDMMCAIQLHQAIISKKVVTRHVRSKKWPDQFRILRQSTDQGLIEDVLDWYCENIKGRFTPRCQSAVSFRKKFDAIQAAMEREGVRPSMNISVRAMALVKQLRLLTWPKGSGEQLLYSIQASLDNYMEFYSRLNAYSSQDGSRLERIAYEVRSQLGGPSQFIRQWFTQVHKDVSDWEGWSGDLVSREFSVDQKRFKGMCQGIAGNYCGRPQEWNNLIGELYEKQQA